MHKKFFFILIFLHLFLLLGSASETQISPQAPDGVYATLEQVSQLALANNFDIQLAKYDAEFSRANLDSARSIYDTYIEAQANHSNDQSKTAAIFMGTKSQTRNYNLGISQKLPTGTSLRADFSNQRSWTDSSYVTLNPAYDSSAKLTLQQELGKNFFGLKDRAIVKISKIDIENAEYSSLDRIEQILSSVHSVYWRIAQGLAVVVTREQMLSQAKDLFQINQKKFSSGIIEEPQLLASEANVKQKEIDLILAGNELEFSINELKFLLNLDDQDRVVLPKDNLDLFIRPLELSDVLKTAFSKRRDYAKAKNEIQSKKIKLVMQANSLWPEINLQASVARNGLDNSLSQAVEDISSEDNPQYFLGINVKFALQNRQARSDANKAKIENAKALINLKKIERQIFIEIQDGVRNCNILAQRVKKQEDVLRLQEEKLAAELKSYEYGRSDTDIIIRYQDDLLLSKLLYTQALLDHKLALLEISLKQNLLLDSYWKDVL